MRVGDTVEIKDSIGSGNWRWNGATGLVTAVDEYCYSVRRDDDSEHIRDVRDHFRPPQDG